MDPLLSPLLILVGVAGAKFLAKKWVGVAAAATGLLDGDVAGELAGGVLDCFQDKLKDVREQRQAARLFEEIGDKIADRLRPTFEQAVKSGQVNVPEVTGELVKTLEARFSAEFFVPADLDPGPVDHRVARRSTGGTGDVQRGRIGVLSPSVGRGGARPRQHRQHAAAIPRVVRGGESHAASRFQGLLCLGIPILHLTATLRFR